MRALSHFISERQDALVYAIAVLAALLVVLFALGLIPDIRASENAAIAAKVDADNGLLCSRFGFDPASSKHSDCKSGLDELRLQDRRAHEIIF
jgi:hypothetical protein